MKLFTINPQAAKLNGTILDYLYELDAKINSLQEYIDNTNPNWVLLNKIEIDKSGNARSFIDMKDLIKYGIIQLAISVQQNEQSKEVLIPYTVLCPNKLKLHKGLVQEYGEYCYYWFYNDDDYPGTRATYKTSSPAYAEKVANWYKQLTHNEKLPNNFNLQYWIQQKDVSTIRSPIGTHPTTENPIINDIALSKNGDHYTLVLRYQDTIIEHSFDNKKIPIPAQQGYAIFCDLIEENKTVDKTNPERRDFSHYKLFPVSPAGDLYIPNSAPVLENNHYVWTWNYVPKGTDKYGTHILFHLPGPHMRLLLHANALKANETEQWYNTATIDLKNNGYIKGFDMQGTTLKPYISNINNTVWNSFKENIILGKFILDNGEEIIFDESLHYDETNFANYRIPRYNITIENMAEEKSVIPTNLNVYLTIV